MITITMELIDGKAVITNSDKVKRIDDHDELLKFLEEQVDSLKAYLGIEEVNNQQPRLDDNQKIVLEWLKKKVAREKHIYDFDDALLNLDDFISDDFISEVSIEDIFWGMDNKKRREVLAAFAQWGLEQEEAE